MPRTDLDLLTRYASGRDAEAFAELVARHRDMVYAACRRLLGTCADAEDCTQECFLQLARSADAVKTSVGAWLHRVAVRTSMAMRKRDRRRRQREREAASMPADQATEPSWDEIKAEGDQAIDELPERLREPLVLHFLEGKGQEAVGRELGLSQSAVATRIKGGVQRLRRHLRRAGFVVSTASLAGLLSARALQAAPAALAAELGKIALSGVGPSGAAVGVSGASGGVGALAGATGKVACLVVAALAGGIALQQTLGRDAASLEGLANATREQGAPWEARSPRPEPLADGAAEGKGRPDLVNAAPSGAAPPSDDVGTGARRTQESSQVSVPSRHRSSARAAGAAPSWQTAYRTEASTPRPPGRTDGSVRGSRVPAVARANTNQAEGVRLAQPPWPRSEGQDVGARGGGEPARSASWAGHAWLRPFGGTPIPRCGPAPRRSAAAATVGPATGARSCHRLRRLPA